jgi:signal transduction histidine kinase
VRQTITPGTAPDGRLDQALVEAQLEQVLDRVHDGVVLTSSGRATLNAAARRILAVPEGLDFRSSSFEPRALDGTPFALDPNQILGEEASGNDTGGPFRIRVTALDGRELVLDGSVSPVVDGAVIVFRDVTDEHVRHELLVQSGKLAAIGELTAGAAHEINNPLFAILGLTEFLLKEADPGSKAKQRLELIQQTGLEIKEIVRALLDFARENAEERHEVALDDVVRSTVDLVRRTNAHKGIELLDTYEDAGALVYARPNQLKQIFLNLIANARQAMPNGGTVTVDVRTEGGFAVATVCDDGPGIEADVLSRIFEPFFTTKRNTGGTGLGLSVSFGIAEAHRGALTAYSEVGRGAQFTLRLPLCDEELER